MFISRLIKKIIGAGNCQKVADDPFCYNCKHYYDKKAGKRRTNVVCTFCNKQLKLKNTHGCPSCVSLICQCCIDNYKVLVLPLLKMAEKGVKPKCGACQQPLKNSILKPTIQPCRMCQRIMQPNQVTRMRCDQHNFDMCLACIQNQLGQQQQQQMQVSYNTNQIQVTQQQRSYSFQQGQSGQGGSGYGGQGGQGGYGGNTGQQGQPGQQSMQYQQNQFGEQANQFQSQVQYQPNMQLNNQFQSQVPQQQSNYNYPPQQPKQDIPECLQSQKQILKSDLQVIEKKPEQPQKVQENVQQPQNKQQQQLEVQNQQDDNRLCVVCIDKPKNVLFTDCKHLALCSDCSEGIDKCPICRVGQVKIQIYV